MAIAEITGAVPANYEVTGVTIAFQQGDVQDSKFYKGMTIDDVSELAEAIEASGEYTFIGFSLTYRLKTYVAKTLVVTPGTADKITWQNLLLKRTAEIGGKDVSLTTLYVLMPISSDATKKTAVLDALMGKTIQGAVVKSIAENAVNKLKG